MGIGFFELIFGVVCLLFIIAVVAGMIVLSMKKPHDQ
jgi:hypothetical protein